MRTTFLLTVEMLNKVFNKIPNNGSVNSIVDASITYKTTIQVRTQLQVYVMHLTVSSAFHHYNLDNTSYSLKTVRRNYYIILYVAYSVTWSRKPAKKVQVNNLCRGKLPTAFHPLSKDYCIKFTSSNLLDGSYR